MGPSDHMSTLHKIMESWLKLHKDTESGNTSDIERVRVDGEKVLQLALHELESCKYNIRWTVQADVGAWQHLLAAAFPEVPASS